MWGLGCILFTVLCGEAPFTSTTDKETIKNILASQFTFSSHFWASTSVEAKDLVNSLLRVDPVERLSSKEVLGHRFVTEDSRYSISKVTSTHYSTLDGFNSRVEFPRWVIPKHLKTPAHYANLRKNYFTSPKILATPDSAQSLCKAESCIEPRIESRSVDVPDIPAVSPPSSDIFTLQDGLLTPSTLKNWTHNLVSSDETDVNVYAGKEHYDSEEEYDIIRENLRLAQLTRSSSVKLNMGDSNLYKRRKGRK